MEFDYLLKLILIGDSGVGKSNIVSRFTDNSFSDETVQTIGVDFRVKTVRLKDQLVKLQIWDTAGHERFRTLTSSYYRGVHGVILVYDISFQDSFDNISHWLREVNKFAPPNANKLLIGNKSDLHDSRAVSYERGESMAQRYRINYLETSAKDSLNVEQAFLMLAEEIVSKYEPFSDDYERHDSIRIGNTRSLDANDDWYSYCSC